MNAQPESVSAPATLARPSPAQLLSFAFCKRHGVLILKRDEQFAEAVYRAGALPAAIAEARRVLGMPLQLRRVDSDAFDQLLRTHYEGGTSVAMQMVGGMEDDTDLAHLAQDLPEPSDLLESDDQAPIIKLINAILTQAVKDNASDIHIEPFENRLVVRFRIDGVLREVLQSKRAVAPLVVSRIKVMSKLDIAEKRLPQDGRISLRVAGRPVDVRVSTIPVGAGGERVVLRLLDKQAGRLDVDTLGLPSLLRTQLDLMIHRPHGILLVTGPTGSGKTTTLYAALQRLNDATRNILTVEDPIEYYLDGIGQTQVNPRVDMSFARGLRALLRQDPDVVMIGEIRDLETAQIAVQSSLTGHLVLSTLHTNSAVGAVTRLRDMGVEPFLISAALLGVLSQRLVRVIDPAQSETYAPTPAECALFGKPWSDALRFCRPLPGLGRNAGYRGRTGLYEMVAIDDAFRNGIHAGASEAELTALARERTPGLMEDGWNKVRAGITSVEEVLRVSRED